MKVLTLSSILNSSTNHGIKINEIKVENKNFNQDTEIEDEKKHLKRKKLSGLFVENSTQNNTNEDNVVIPTSLSKYQMSDFFLYDIKKPLEKLIAIELPFENEFINNYLKTKFNTVLYQYQVEAVRWMYGLEMEKINNKKLVSHTGGVLGDEMGLGKTIEGLARVSYDIFICEKNKMARNTFCTLILTNVTLLDQWKVEAMTKFGIEENEIFIFRGPKRQEKLMKLKKNNEFPILILGTYQTLEKDSNNLQNESIIFKTKLWRVILDEAHAARNSKTKKSHACKRINTNSLFCFTGTPFINSPNDIKQLSSLCTPDNYISKTDITFWEKEIDYWKAKYFLRREKDVCNLPSIENKYIWLEFSNNEQEIYKKLVLLIKDECKNIILSEVDNSKIFQRLLLLLMKLRQSVNHVYIAQGNVITKKILQNTKTKYNVKSINLQELKNQEIIQNNTNKRKRNNDEEEIIQIKKIEYNNKNNSDDDFLDENYFQFEKNEEIENVKISSYPSSPLISSPEKTSEENLEYENNIQDKINKLVKCTNDFEKSFFESKTVDDIEISTKIQEILNILKNEKQNDPTCKIVIISQFTTMLDMIECFLIREKYNSVRFDGNQQSPHMRRLTIQAFKTIPEIDVLLTSLHAGGIGLNFVPGNILILVDPWWNQSIENQAITRIHRLPQTKAVRTYRTLIKNSIEEKVIQIQKQKNSQQIKFYGKDNLNSTNDLILEKNNNNNSVKNSVSLNMDDIKYVLETLENK